MIHQKNYLSNQCSNTEYFSCYDETHSLILEDGSEELEPHLHIEEAPYSFNLKACMRFPSLFPIYEIQTPCTDEYVLKNQKFTFLNGKVSIKHIMPEDGFVSLSQNLELAKKINAFVRERIFLSNTHPNHNGQIKESTAEINTVIKKMRDESTLLQRVEHAVNCGAGNCGEMAMLGLTYITDTRVQQLSVGQDHCVLLIGNNSDPLSSCRKTSNWTASFNPQDWKHCVICDPLLNSYYPIDLWQKYLLDFGGLITVHNDTINPSLNCDFPIVEPLQSPRQITICCFTNGK